MRKEVAALFLSLVGPADVDRGAEENLRGVSR
jgi:hypothetical protein